MRTKLFIHKKNHQIAITEAAALLKAGEVVAFPTETVYGLGADATNERAVSKIFKAKGRPGDNPLIVHVACKQQLFELVQTYPAYVEKLIAAFSPGPITYVLPSNGRVAANVTAGLPTVGVRIPDHKAALALLEMCGLPLAAPSANVSGKPSPTTAKHVLDDLDGKIAAVLDGGAAYVGVESTVVDCTRDVPVILRVGQIKKEAIQQVVGSVEVACAAYTTTPKSPGVKYKHYMPEVPLYLVMDQAKMNSIIDCEKRNGKKIGILFTGENQPFDNVDKTFYLGDDEREIAANLYDTLRQMKKRDVDIVFAIIDSPKKIGSAVMDRLGRAATNVIN